MHIRQRTFADIYNYLIDQLPIYKTDIDCRGLHICYEMINVELRSFHNNKVYIFSNFNSRCVPIRFILAEFLWILSSSNELYDIARFNSRMMHFSDDKVVLNGAYGHRLKGQLEAAIDRIIEDKHTRQAFVDIHHPYDAIKKSKDIPCNTSIQFLIRNDKLNMRIISRSSDFVTGLCIDLVHWQILLQLFLNTLKKTYPMLLPGEIVYHIGSLHVYDIDKFLMEKWKTDIKSDQYTHDFHIRDDFFSLRKRTLSEFKDAELLVDLAKIYDFSMWETDRLLEMNKDFVRQKSRPVR